MMISKDRTVGGYELEELVAQSAAGLLYRARDVRLQRQVALRIVAADVAADPVMRARLNREVTALASVDHPNVPPIYEAGEHAGRIFIASRWIDAPRLTDFVRECGPLEPKRAVRIANQVADALQAAHALGIIHRNVKPSRVLMAQGDLAYLTDFSVARRLSDMTGLTVQEQVVEQFDYVAPEYIEGREIDARVDIYGLGCVLYEALTGEVPYPRSGGPAKMYAHLSAEPPSPRARRPDIPEALDRAVRRALAKAPDDRQQSAAEFASETAGAIDLSAPLWAGRRARPKPAVLGSPRVDRVRAERAESNSRQVHVGGATARDSAKPLVPAVSAEEPAAQDPPRQDPHRAVEHPRGERAEYYETVYFRVSRGLARRRAVKVVALLIFLAAPLALLIAVAAHAATI
jgi:serine/threonine-protein kinase